LKLDLIGTVIRFLIQGGCLLLVAVGLWYIFGNSIKNMFREQQYYRKLEKTVSAKKTESRSSAVIEHIANTLSTVLVKQVNTAESYIFLIASMVIFLFSFLMFFKIYSLSISIILAAMLSIFPYLVLRLKLRAIRIDSSYDADILVIGITNEYKQHYHNMIQAIENCAIRDDIGGYSKRNLYRLSLALKAYHSEEDLDAAIEQFVYSYNTEWAGLLGINIKIAIHRGTNVSSGLEDILKKLKDIREQIETSKRYNNEAFTMIRFLLVPLYLASIYFAMNTFGFTIKKFFEYQFLNPIGLRMAIMTLMSVLTSFIALMIIRKPKYDI